MIRSALLILVIAGLTACQSLAPGVEQDVHTGVAIAHAAVVRAASSIEPNETLYARPYFSTEGGYGLNTLFYGRKKPGFAEAWSFGTQFKY